MISLIYNFYIDAYANLFKFPVITKYKGPLISYSFPLQRIPAPIRSRI